MNDDELIGFLRSTLAPAAVPPPAAGLAALHRALTEEGVASRPGWYPRRRWAIPAVTTAMLLGGATAALAAGGLPEPLRDAAQLVRLPVSDPHRPSMSELVGKLRSDRARGDRHAATQDARDLETMLRRGTGNPTDRAEADQTLEDEAPEVPQATSRPGAPTTAPDDNQSPETEPETEPAVVPSPTVAPTVAPTEPDSPGGQPNSPTPTTEASEPTTTTSQPPSAPTSEPSATEPTTQPAVEP